MVRAPHAQRKVIAALLSIDYVRANAGNGKRVGKSTVTAPASVF
jgi:hypothetical protein